MKLPDIKLPSNKKFVFFFTIIFILLTSFFYFKESFLWAYFFASTSSIFLIITIVNANILRPLNKLWMYLGLILGLIISPIVLGIIFFGIFTPIAIIMRLSGRDELHLKFKIKQTHWINRKSSKVLDSFKKQFQFCPQFNEFVSRAL